MPGVLYGGKGEAQAIEVDHNPLFHALRKERFHASILDMELDGASERVLLRAFQMHPYKAQVLHIDFQRVAEDQKLHMRVPLHFSGQESSPAAKTEGVLISHVMSEVAIACLPKDLPEYIAVDLTELTVTDTVRVRDLKMPAGVVSGVKGQGKSGRRCGDRAWRRSGGGSGGGNADGGGRSSGHGTKSANSRGSCGRRQG